MKATDKLLISGFLLRILPGALIYRILFCLLIYFFCLYNSSAQEKKLFSNFRKLSGPEKRWVITHPFVAKKAWKITSDVIIKARKISDTVLDSDPAGGRADAFRHTFWIFSLCSEIHWRKALKLGNAHEKGNRRDFKKGKTEDGIIADKVSMEMDLFNNQYGILLGRQYSQIPEAEKIAMVIKAVQNGDLKIVKKDKNGNSLDENGNIVSGWQGKWENERTLVRSDYQPE